MTRLLKLLIICLFLLVPLTMCSESVRQDAALAQLDKDTRAARKMLRDQQARQIAIRNEIQAIKEGK